MDEIERLELQIEELREAIERSRRFALAGRASVVAGPALLVAILLGLVAFTPARTVFALALAIGGMVLSGSSRATTEELRHLIRLLGDRFLNFEKFIANEEIGSQLNVVPAKIRGA